MQTSHDGSESDFVKKDGDIQAKTIIQETIVRNGKEDSADATKDRHYYYYQYHPLDSSVSLVQINFIICRNCYWCASLLGEGIFIKRCPGCSESMLEAIPIASNERFNISKDQRRGIIFQFSLRAR